MYVYVKALHIISVISWFAGLVYLGRVFIYHREASDKSELESKVLISQFSIMEKRVLNYICHPAMCLSFIFGLYMLFYAKIYYQNWFHFKFVLIILLFIYLLVNHQKDFSLSPLPCVPQSFCSHHI